MIDASLAEGMSCAAIARRESATGFDVSQETVLRHAKEHYIPPPPEGVAVRKKDVATIVAERTLEWLERENEAGEKIGPEAANWRDALGPGLQAQKILDTREARTDDKKLMLAFAHLLSGLNGGTMLAPPNIRQLPETVVIEGEAEEVE